VREQAVAKLDKKGNKLPLEKRYSARHFSLDIVFECVIIEERNTAEVPWYCRVDNWDGYNNYLSSKKTLDKPDRMSYSEWNPIGQDQ
jgi:hypothetical protein